MYDLRSHFLKSLLTFAIVALTGCGFGVRLATISTTVAPLATDDLSGPCSYEVPISTNPATQNAVLVIFERGDSLQLFEDPSVQQMALDLHITTVFAHQCNAISYGDLQSNASKGPARALVTALGQFAVTTHHPELATAPVILYGFSAAGALAMTMTEAKPDRVLGAIAYAPGSAHLNLQDLPLISAAGIPMLILANADDQIVGTSRNKTYFQRGRALGAPWGYAVQNNTGHCCNLSTLNVILPWIRAIVAKQSAIEGSTVSFRCVPNGVSDSYNSTDCSFAFAGLGKPTSATQQTGWLPDSSSAQAWFTWVTNPATN